MNAMTKIPDADVRVLVETQFTDDELNTMIWIAQTPDEWLHIMQPMTQWGVRKIRESLDKLKISWRDAGCLSS